MSDTADIIDVANNYSELMLDAAISNRVVYRGVSAEFCGDCDSPIPEARRLAVPGVELCIACAERNEAKRRHLHLR